METLITKQLEKLEDDIKNCKKCPLYQMRGNYAIYRGNIYAKTMIIGEALGEQECKEGKPFVGRAGKLLDKILIEAGLNPDKDVYICNILKDRPPNNRKPFLNEIESCLPFLEKQIEIIKPKAIITLGSTATETLINQGPISKIRGQFFKHQRQILLVPTFHPSYILRQMSKKELVIQDILLVKNYLQKQG